MSSETSTRPRKRKDTMPPAASEAPAPAAAAGAFQPWHLFVIATLFASSAAAIAVRGTSPTNVIFVCLTVLTAGVAAYAVYRTLSPLVSPDSVEVPEMVGGRTRAALEREKTLVLRAIKELEFDRAMGKVSETDWQEMTGRLRLRAVRLIRQLDSGSAVYRDLIEKELAARDAAAGGSRATPNASHPVAGAGVLLALAAAGLLSAAVPAHAQMGGMGGTGMPDARAMSGIARPSDTVPTGSVSVRLVRGQISNIIPDFPVQFEANGKTQTVKTDATGHAVLGGLAPGTAVRAVATVDGERLESQDLQVPPQGGMVLMLVASDRSTPQQMARDAVPGTVTIGGQSRVVVQFEDEVLQVFYLLDLVNGGQAPVKTSAPLVFEMPRGASNVSLIEGSSPLATAKGSKVTVTGPFPPGSTSVQIGFQMPPGESARFRFALPAALAQPTVIVEKLGATTLSSTQLASAREVNDAGKTFIMAAGAPLSAGATFEFTVSGLPHHPTWPRNLALALAVLLLGAGAWGSFRRGAGSGEVAARQALERRRERVFAELQRLERQRRNAGADQRDYESRRAALVAELEKIYGELDAEGRGAAGAGSAA